MVTAVTYFSISLIIAVAVGGFLYRWYPDWSVGIGGVVFFISEGLLFVAGKRYD